MAARPGTYQAIMTSGELDERVHGQTGLKQYYAGLKRAQRVVAVPQGGVTNTGVMGLDRLGEQRPSLVPYPLSAGMVSLPNGGTPAANLVDADLTTVITTSVIAADAVLVQLDLGQAINVAAVDVLAFRSAIASAGRWLTLQHSEDALNWTEFPRRYAIDTNARTRRYSVQFGNITTARYIRIMAKGVTASLGAVTIGGLQVLQQGALVRGRVRSFNFNRAESYDFIMTPGNIDVYSSAGFQASIPTALTAAMLPEFDFPQQLDTALIFHEDLPSEYIQRQGANDEWNTAPFPARNLPEVDFGAVYANGRPTIYTVQLVSAGAGSQYTITVNGEDTEAITVDASNTVNETRLKAAIESLPSVEVGLTVVYNATKGLFEVSFTGAGNEGDGYTMTGRIVTPATAAIVVSKQQKGKAGGEPIMSATRGWPACGCFLDQQRLMLGGFRTKPNAWLASVAGDAFDFNTEIVAATGAILGGLNTDGAERIIKIVSGRFIQFFASESEWFITDRVLSRQSTPNVVNATTNGIVNGVPVVKNGTASLFIHQNASNLIEFKYSDADQSYVDSNISSLSTGLLANVSDMAVRRARSAEDAAHLFVVNADGTARIVALLREQEVTAPSRFDTDGVFLSVAVNGRGDATFLVERNVAGAIRIFIERQTDLHPLDCAVTGVAAGALVSGLAREHEGATVWALANNQFFGPYTVFGGTITLPESPTGNVIVGRWMPSTAILLPIPKDVGQRVVLDRPVHVTAVRANVIGTSSVALGTEIDGPFNIPLARYGEAPDANIFANPFTGKIEIEGLRGWDDDGCVVITQVSPGKLTLRNTTVEADR